MKKIKGIVFCLSAPIITAAVLLITFYLKGLYPFGTGSVTWCDMSQQTIPLLLDFKDILEGKGSLFLNMNNAGGMNFYGVFFFFLSSPFSLLVKFIEKADMVLFVNILVILKLTLCSFTAYLFFRFRQKNTDNGVCVFLSVMYALCGYGMLFYQNLMWLDVMYLFPLLMLSLEWILKGKSNLFYIIILSLIIIVNYYITFMVGVFVLIFAGVHILKPSRNEDRKMLSLKLVSGTAVSILITAICWLPSLLQVMSSGRGKDLKETLLDTGFLSSYQTVLPLLFCSAFVFAVLGIHILSGKKRSPAFNRYLVLFVLTLIPFLAEPINLMWHTGHYMSFPARYGFITVLLGLICTAEIFNDNKNELTKVHLKYNIPFTALGISAVTVYALWLTDYVDKNIFDLSAYTDTLWGNYLSFDSLARMFFVALICYGLIYVLYHYKKIALKSFVVLIITVLIFESYGNTRVYMTSYYERQPTRTKSFKSITDMADKIEDDDFYRVITDEKITDYNMIGALGYPTLSHYTSLTDKDFMFTQKRLGYTSVWMEVSAHGGTELTNALYSAKYKLVRGENDNAVYSSNGYSIIKEPYYLNLGLVTDGYLTDKTEIPSGLTRAEAQQYIFSALYGNDTLITEYDYTGDSSGIAHYDGKYHIYNGAEINYILDISGKQSVYFDCFDRLSNDLSEDYYDSLSVSVNGVTFEGEYPTVVKNGLLNLGEYENEQIEIKITAHKNISCYSFGVFGLDTALLKNKLGTTNTANLKYKDGKITGNYIAENDNETCLLSLPYNEGITVKVNGKKAEYYKTLSDFTSFKLKKGENNIEISFIPKGFKLGLLLSVIGVILLVIYILLYKKLNQIDWLKDTALILASAAVLIGVFAVYIYPIAVFIKEGI